MLRQDEAAQEELARANQQVQSLLYKISQQEFQIEQMRVQLQNKDDCIALRDQQLDKQSHFVTEFQKLLELKDHEKQHLQNNISAMTQEHLEQVTNLNYQLNAKDKKLQQLDEELQNTKAQL